MKVRNKFHGPIQAFIDFKRWVGTDLYVLFKYYKNDTIIKELNIPYKYEKGIWYTITIKPVKRKK